MTRPSIEYALAADCFKSPDNVRTQSDTAADAELEANIAETGIVLENLIGVRVARGALKGKIEIYGGGRRLDAVHANIAKQVLDTEFMVPVLVAKGAKDAIEMSLAENYFQLPMNPADECCAFRSIIEREKKTAAELARRFGKTEKFVLGRLRLANLASPIFEALRLGAIGIEVAKAYATTADQDRQAKVFEQLSGGYYATNVNEIRRSLASGAYNGADPKALLVGRAAYEAAGGRIEQDLFSDAATELWLDGEIVERLAEEALQSAAEALRERDGFAEVRTVAATSVPYSTTYRLREMQPEPRGLSEEEVTRQTEIEAELEAIERAAEEQPEYTDEQSERFDQLSGELEALTDARAELTPTQKAGAIAYVVIGRDGTPVLSHEYFHIEEPEASTADEGDSEDADGENDDADAAGPQGCESDEGEDGGPATALTFSNRQRDELATMKTELLQLFIASDPAFALDLGTFIMADKASRQGWSAMPSDLRAYEPSPRVSGFVSGTAAQQQWSRLESGLDRSWLEHETIEARYDAFCGLDGEARAAWLGWAIARTMHAVPHGEAGSGFLDHLGDRLAIDVAAWWRPTASNFFDRLTKPKILGLFETIGGPELSSRYSTSRKFDLSLSAEKLFAGDVLAEPEIKERARRWLPDAMRFGPEQMNDGDECDDLIAEEPGAEAQTITGVADEADDEADDEGSAIPFDEAA